MSLESSQINIKKVLYIISSHITTFSTLLLIFSYFSRHRDIISYIMSDLKILNTKTKTMEKKH